MSHLGNVYRDHVDSVMDGQRRSHPVCWCGRRLLQTWLMTKSRFYAYVAMESADCVLMSRPPLERPAKLCITLRLSAVE